MEVLVAVCDWRLSTIRMCAYAQATVVLQRRQLERGGSLGTRYAQPEPKELPYYRPRALRGIPESGLCPVMRTCFYRFDDTTVLTLGRTNITQVPIK